MKYFAVIDCGTTNSRVYILDKNKKIIAKGSKKIGVRDSALQGTRDVLREGLKELFEKIVVSAHLSINDISFALTFGMITSEIGLIEIPHLWAPISIDDLASNIKVVHDHNVFPLNFPIYFIRGVKNYFTEDSTYKDLRSIDFMRGEETQVAGLLSLYPHLTFPVIMVVLSSHTKFIYINKEKQISGSLTTLSGQIFEAIKKETSIGKSIQSNNKETRDNGYFNEDIVDTAYDSVKNAGFLRTLMMPRFMEVLLQTNWYERELFTNSAITADDLVVLNEFKNLNFSLDCEFVLVGHKTRCEIFSYLLKKYYQISKISNIYDEEEMIKLSIEGAIAIAQKAGYFKS